MRPIRRVAVAAGIAFAALLLYDREEVDPETFALAPTVTLSTEAWEGQTFTASDVGGITALITHEKEALPEQAGNCRPFLALWLGNSQLHYINQSQPGDHVAPFWLRKESTCPDTTVPLGISLPNANLQEHYVLARYTLERLPIKLMLLELCFDDLREDGLRDEFSSALTDTDRAALRENPVGHDVIARAEAGWKSANRDEENSGLTGFVQKEVEDRLDASLGRIFPLWRDRKNLRVKVMTDLYFLRNDLLGIKPTTIRKLIPARYERNMAALGELLHQAQQRGVKTMAYIAPIRHDLPLPYDENEYRQWKGEIEQLAQAHGASLVNFENLIPAELWGSYVADDVDFMHFRGKGHQLLAERLVPYVEKARRDDQ